MFFGWGRRRDEAEDRHDAGVVLDVTLSAIYDLVLRKLS
jgi:hypothetical protein